MTSVVVSQPMYWPWCGFIAQMALSDIFIWLDDVQFSKGSFTNRVQLKSHTKHRWLTIGLEAKGSFQKISDLRPVDLRWRELHRAKIQTALANYQNHEQAFRLYDSATESNSLCLHIMKTAELAAQALNVLPPTILKSSAISTSGAKTDRVISLVKAVGGTRYITGHGAASYLQHERFEAEGIAVCYMNYAPIPWPQAHPPFSPYVSVLDLIASVGQNEAAQHLNPQVLDWREFFKMQEERTDED